MIYGTSDGEPVDDDTDEGWWLSADGTLVDELVDDGTSDGIDEGRILVMDGTSDGIDEGWWLSVDFLSDGINVGRTLVADSTLDGNDEGCWLSTDGPSVGELVDDGPLIVTDVDRMVLDGTSDEAFVGRELSADGSSVGELAAADGTLDGANEGGCLVTDVPSIGIDGAAAVIEHSPQVRGQNSCTF